MIKVSILIPVYNQEKLIEKCIKSIPNRDDIEIVVVDDGSNDNTYDVAARALSSFKNTKLLKNIKNIGIGLTRNKLLANVSGQYIFFLDSDDFVYADGFNAIVDKYLNADIIKPKRIRNDKTVYSAHVFQGWFAKRSLFKGCSCIDSNFGEDHDLYIQVCKNNANITEIEYANILVYHYNFPRVGSAVWNVKHKKAVICAIAKNENRYINDWISYHLKLGFEHIYIYDNNDSSAPKLLDAIDKKYQKNITIYDINNRHEKMMQIKYYNEFYRANNVMFDWCAFIDVDEFIHLPLGKNINTFLADKRFSMFDIIRLKWHLHGDDDLLFRDVRHSVFKDIKTTLTDKDLVNQGKHIIRGNLGKRVQVCSCHYSKIDGVIKNSCYADGVETHDEITLSPAHENDTYIDHYMTKTISEFVIQKYNRGDACFDTRKIDWNYFWRINNQTPEKLAYAKAIKNPIRYWCYSNKNNAGDIYTKFLFKALGLPLILVERESAELFCTGSILQQVKNTTSFVIGAGLHNKNNSFHGDLNKLLGVRGYETLNELGLKGYKVGDPGLLLSYIYKPTSEKKYKYGIIAHYTDYAFLKKFETKNCPVLNMGLKSDSEKDFYELVDKINECEFIFSSSLHGIIFAHSLGIPAIHLENKMLYSKENFKFKDYYSTLDIVYSKISAEGTVNFEEIMKDAKKYLPSKTIIEKLQKNIIDEITYFLVNRDEKMLPLKQSFDEQRLTASTVQNSEGRNETYTNSWSWMFDIR